MLPSVPQASNHDRILLARESGRQLARYGRWQLGWSAPAPYPLFDCRNGKGLAGFLVFSVGGIFLGPLFNVSYGSRYGLGCEILNGYS